MSDDARDPTKSSADPMASPTASRSMDERLDFLLSAALDDELDSAERDELDRRLAEFGDSDAVARSASFEAVDDLVRSLAGASLISRSEARGEVGAENDLEAGIAAIRARLDEENIEGVEELSDRRRDRRQFPNWAAPLAMAAAAVAIYLMVPQTSFIWVAPGAESRVGPASEEPRWIDDPIALAVVFELDYDSESIELVDGMSADDFEIVETLELMEFLAARESGARG